MNNVSHTSLFPPPLLGPQLHLQTSHFYLQRQPEPFSLLPLLFPVHINLLHLYMCCLLLNKCKEHPTTQIYLLISSSEIFLPMEMLLLSILSPPSLTIKQITKCKRKGKTCAASNLIFFYMCILQILHKYLLNQIICFLGSDLVFHQRVVNGRGARNWDKTPGSTKPGPCARNMKASAYSKSTQPAIVLVIGQKSER